MKNKSFVLGAIVLGLVVFIAISFFSKPISTVSQQPVVTGSTGETAASFVRPHSPSFGNSLARVTVVEWFDPECESCRELHPVFQKIMKDYKDRVHFVLRYML